MSSPRQLIEEGATTDELALLRAGIDEAPPDGALERALLATGLSAGVAAGVSAAGGGAAAAKGVGSAWIWSLGGKVVLGVALGGALLAAAASAWMGRGESTATGTAATAEALSAPPVAAAPGAPPAALPEDAARDQAPAASSASAPARPATPRSARPELDSIAPQIAAIDGARGALARGANDEALAALARYELDFPRGAFGHEVTAVRIQAYLAKGDRAAATTIGKRFLLAHPRSPLAHRIESMLGLGSGSEPPAKTAE